MNIRFLLSSDRVSGQAGPVTELAMRLHQAGHQVRVTCKTVEKYVSNPLTDHLAAIGLNWDTSLRLNRNWNPFDFYRDYRELARQLDEDETDVVHCHYRTDHLIAAAALPLARRRPVLIRTRHHSKLELFDPIHRFLYQARTDHLVEICAKTARRDRQLLGLDENRVSVIYGAIPQEALLPVAPVNLREELQLLPHTKLIGYPGRLVSKRDPERLVRFMAPLLKSREDVFFVLLGRGPMEQEIARLIGQLDIEEKTRILGYRKDYVSALKALDLIVYFREGTDGTCRALLEGMALQVPCIVPDFGPLDEIVSDGVTGLVFPDKDGQAFLDRAHRILDDDDLRMRLGKAAQKVAQERFHPDVSFAAYLQVYHDCLGVGSQAGLFDA